VFECGRSRAPVFFFFFFFYDITVLFIAKHTYKKLETGN